MRTSSTRQAGPSGRSMARNTSGSENDRQSIPTDRKSAPARDGRARRRRVRTRSSHSRSQPTPAPRSDQAIAGMPGIHRRRSGHVGRGCRWARPTTTLVQVPSDRRTPRGPPGRSDTGPSSDGSRPRDLVLSLRIDRAYVGGRNQPASRRLR
jgi:hypothetical protein